MTIRQNLEALYNELPPHVRIVAVSKTMPVETVLEAYNAGHRLFGENRSQELISKQPYLPADLAWHFIGHLQSNKVKYIVPLVEMIQSVDSLKILSEINKEAGKSDRIVKCLLQFHIATEETKFGLDIEESKMILESREFREMMNISITGLMGIASFTDDQELVRSEFRHLREIRDDLRDKYFRDDPAFCELSMGMTGDYRIAVEEGSTIVRIGTGIFGSR